MQTHFVQTDILSWEDIPMVSYSVKELEQLENKDGRKGDFEPKHSSANPKALANISTGIFCPVPRRRAVTAF